MAIFMSSSNISFERHPKYHGVMIAILAGKADGQGKGLSLEGSCMGTSQR